MPDGFEWRNLINTRDIGDVVALVMSIRRLLARRTEQAAHSFERDVRQAETHILDDVVAVATRLSLLVGRKSQELSRTRKETTKRVNKEVQHGLDEAETAAEHLRDNVESRAHQVRDEAEGRARQVRDVVDQKSYDVAKQIVKSHEDRYPTADGSFGLFFVGAVIGTLVGAALAIWYAPQSGEQTREEIEHVAAETRHRIEGESAADAIRAGKEEVRRLQQTPGAR